MSTLSLHLTRGLPGSGKSTLARSWVEDDSANRQRVNRDDTRIFLGLKHGENEPFVTQVQHSTVRLALKAGKDVIVDDTNLNSRFAKEWLRIAAEFDADVIWHDDYLKVPLPVCIERDQARTEGHVGAKVITDMYQRYFRGPGVGPKRPELDVQPLATTKPYFGTPGKPKAFLVDIDGTIASNGTDRDHPNRGYFEWHRVGEDLPIEKVIDVVLALEETGLIPIFVSGRDGSCFEETRNWIIKHVYDGWPNWDDEILLHMRPEGDNRKDSIVKLEIFDNEIRDNYDVQWAIDDRDQVVKAYRGIGLTVLAVAEGDF